MKNIAIILAGGTGSRVGGERPKQFLFMEDGRTVLEHSVEAFERAECITEIAIVMHPDWIEESKHLCEKNEWQKVTKIIPGGAERWESSWHALLAYDDLISYPEGRSGDVSIWFHDAARPFVSQRILADVAEALETHEAVTVAIPVTDTIYRVESQKSKVESAEETVVQEVPERTAFLRAQTPQAFRYEVIFDAFAKAIESENVIATDDAGIVRKYAPKHKIFIVRGEEINRKITYRGDLAE